MDKKQQIAFLEGGLSQTIGQLLEVEVSLAGLTTMNLVGKDQTKVTQTISANRTAKENLQVKIASYRKVIERIQRGEIVI